MSCSKHPSDPSSSVGVCASCLRERLLAVIAAEALHRSQETDFSNSDTEESPPCSFSRSASVSSRQHLDCAAETRKIGGGYRRSYNTCAGSIEEDEERKRGRLSSLILGIFGSKSRKSSPASHPISDPLVSVDSYNSDSSSWISNIVFGRRKEKIKTFPVDENVNGKQWNINDRMSPERPSDEVYDNRNGGSSGGASESSRGWVRTPASMRRGETKKRAKSASNVAFCLSPLLCATTGVVKERRRR